ncbi:MAG: hypothetical protein KIT18_10170 [Burkholderiales bacterium]|nr:hypothetical protein [Burkholderiales bacterium]
MPWLRKRSAAAAPVPAESITPAALPLALDAQLFRTHYAQLLAHAEQGGGIDAHLAALAAKRDLHAGLLARVDRLSMEDVERLLGTVFTARRRLYPALEQLGIARLSALLAALVSGPEPLVRRMQALADAMPGATATDRESLRAAAKLRRAAWDFAAEIVHYGDPERYPLMTRWVWDEGAQSGALREFVRGGDALREIPFTNDPAVFEGARHWLAQQLAAEGVSRDVPLWMDLVQAQAYLSYVRSVAEGSLGGDFGRGTPPPEQLKKLLGIDAVPDARPRVRKVAV